MSKATQNLLKGILTHLEKDIADLVEDADPIRQFLSETRDAISLALLDALIVVSEIED